jgi:hypothetical protein
MYSHRIMAFAPALIAYRTMAPAAMNGIIGSAVIVRIRTFESGNRCSGRLTKLAGELLGK